MFEQRFVMPDRVATFVVVGAIRENLSSPPLLSKLRIVGARWTCAQS